MKNQLSIVIFGNTNNYPLLLAEGLVALGHRVRLILNRKELLHRPESKYPEWRNAYPGWIKDFSHLSDEDIAFQTPGMHKLIHELTHDIDLAILNDIGPALSCYLSVPHISLLTGSDLTFYADYSFLEKRTTGWESDFKRSSRGRRDLFHMAELVTRQRDGILASDAVSYAHRNLIPGGDRLLDSIGVANERRMMMYLSNVNGLTPRPFLDNKKFKILCGSRIVFCPDANPSLSAIDFKGTDILLSGYAEYCKRGGQGELRLPRKGQDVEAAKLLAQKWGIADRIVWLDEMSLVDFYQEMIGADLVCDQVGESFPGMVTLDAYALGRPVLANFRNDVFKNVFSKPLPGYQVSTAEEIATALLKAENDPAGRKNLGKESRAFAEAYLSPVKMAEQLLSKCRFDQRSERSPNILKSFHPVTGHAPDKFQWLGEEDLQRLLNNPKLLRVFLFCLKALDAIPGIGLVRAVLSSVRKNGLSISFKNARSKLNDIFQKIKMSRLLGMNLDDPIDSQYPDKRKFISPRAFSHSAKVGKPSVCLVTVNLSSGGAERQVVGLARELKKTGHAVRVRVLKINAENGHYLPLLKEQNVDVAVPAMPSAEDLKFMKERGADLSLLRHVPKELRLATLALALDLMRSPVDIAHCYLDWSCCYGGFAALLSGTPAVRLSWRNVNPSHFEFYREWMPHLYRYYLSFSNFCFENNTSCGAKDYAEWLNIGSEKIEVMHNGIATELFSENADDQNSSVKQLSNSEAGVSDEAPLIINAGRLSDEKRPLDLPKILSRLQNGFPSVRMAHIGVGPMEESLRRHIKEMGLSDEEAASSKKGSLTLMGRRADIFKIMKASDVLLLTSEQEGMPNVVMEAMYAGIPVVSTRVGGVPDLIEDGVQGFLHDVGDIAGMAKSLEKILRDPALKKKMGDAGRERILSKFTVQHLANRVTQAYLFQISQIK